MSVKELKKQAKMRGLKGYSTLGKSAVINLLALDAEGKAPVKNLTSKRKKELAKVGAGDLTLEEEENFTDNPAVGISGPTRPSATTLKPSKRKSQSQGKPPKIPKRPSKASVIKKVKAKKKMECGKYNNLNKKSLSQLMGLL